MLTKLNKTLSKLTKLNTIQILFSLSLLILVIYIIFSWRKNRFESFETQATNFIIKKSDNIYDDFYANMYDKLVYNKIKNNWEIGIIRNTKHPSNRTILLDVGSGTGHHVGDLNKQGLNSIGVDISPSMNIIAKQNYPDSEFKTGDVLNTMIFQIDSFTHITCLYFTIYYIKDKRKFFMNCSHWLLPGGYLILHLVDRDNFDPIIPAGKPCPCKKKEYKERNNKMINNNSNSNNSNNSKREISTIANIDNYKYKSIFDFIYEKDEAILEETFKNQSNGDIRTQEHHFYMPSQREILSIAKDCGFILSAKYSMKDCMYDNQYLYVLQKPE